MLLKNDGVLPIVRTEEPRRIYLTGPNAASVDVLLGNYFGMSDSLVTVLEGLTAASPEHYKVEYRMGLSAVTGLQPRRFWPSDPCPQIVILLRLLSSS